MIAIIFSIFVLTPIVLLVFNIAQAAVKNSREQKAAPTVDGITVK